MVPPKQNSIRTMGATAIDSATETNRNAYVTKYTGRQGISTLFMTLLGGSSLDTRIPGRNALWPRGELPGLGSHSLAPLSFKSATYSGVFTLTPLLTGEGRETSRCHPSRKPRGLQTGGVNCGRVGLAYLYRGQYPGGRTN